MTDEEMKEKIRNLITKTAKRSISRSILCRPEMMAWINSQCEGRIDTINMKLSEKIYIAINSFHDAFCDRGNKRIFNTIHAGYRQFCSNNCACKKEHQATIITIKQSQVSEEERKCRLAKQEKTLLEHHGVTNPMHIPESIVKIRATNQKRYGGDHHMASLEVRNKIIATNQERYGVDFVFQNKEILQKSADTYFKNHGKPNTMEEARDGFLRKTGFDNPFKMKIYQDKAKETRFARTGFSNALQNPETMQNMREKNFVKWGYLNVALHPEVQEKKYAMIEKKYGRKYVNHISDENYAILQDKEKFKALFKEENLSLREVSLKLGLSYDGARKYCARYDIVLPRSTYEEAIAAFIDSLGITMKRGDRKLTKPYEIDILLSNEKIGIEFCGLYWHGDNHKDDKNYHLNKKKMMDIVGYRLLTIFEDEWLFKREIVEKRILHALKISQSGVSARETTVRKIDKKTSYRFLEKYHIQGSGPYGFVNYGAFDKNDNLIAVMRFSNKRDGIDSKNSNAIELVRFATDGFNHVGVGSKLFAQFVADYNPWEVISFADRRWSDGNFYYNLGFEFIKASKPNYWYVHKNNVYREHRLKYKKSKIINSVPNGKNKTEREIMKERGYYRIYDCGSLRFSWRPQNK